MKLQKPLRTAVVVPLLIAVLVSAGLTPGCGENRDPLVFGFVAETMSQDLSAQSAMLGEQISARLGLEVEVFAFNSTLDLALALGSGQADIALLPALAYVAAHDTFGAHPLLRCVRKGSDTFRGELVALTEGGPATVEDLQGLSVGFVSETSVAGYFLPAGLMMDEGLNPAQDLGEMVFTGGHQESILAVLSGEVDAAACRVDARSDVYAEVKDVYERVSVIAKTPPFPNETLVVRAGLESELVIRLKEALESAASSGEGRVAWKAVSRSDGFIEAEDPDYDVVRQVATRLGLDFERMLRAGD